MTRECGTCNACCVYPMVPELKKPADTPCRFLEACGYGCQVYEARPKSCRNYTCAWIEGHGGQQDSPVLTGVLIDRRETRFGMALVARPLHPGAGKTKEALSAMRRMSRDLGMVVLVVSEVVADNERVTSVVGERRVMRKFKAANPMVKVYPDGSVRELV